MSESKNLVGKNALSEDWDDTAILNSFESGITSFRTKAQSKPIASNPCVNGKTNAEKVLSNTSATAEQQTKLRPRSFGDNGIESDKRLCISLNETSKQVPKSASVSIDASVKTSVDQSTAGTSGIPTLPGLSGANDEALQSMLMAWYYSGYATGRYQALKEVEEAAEAERVASAQHCDQKQTQN